VHAMAEKSVAKRVVFACYALLFILGLAFYVCWSVAYNTWMDVGVYAFSATLMAFGIVGMLLYRSS